MQRWLVKTEPSAYSWDDLVRDGQTSWDGIRNAQANINLRAMSAGDQVLIYHSVDQRAIVGLAQVATAAAESDAGLVWLRPVQALAPLALATIKALPALAGWQLVRQPRLSVLPITAEQWQALAPLLHLAEE